MERTTVYTDGACLGNPGPGGWAWAMPGGRWRSGAERRTTNQRMELTAVLDAIRSLGSPLEVVSDSTYVVNCFKQRWWVKWVANGWVGSTKKPVANRDLWEPLVELYREVPGRLEFRWVKGHGADPFNDLVDRLAVAAASEQRGGEGERPPSSGELGPADEVVRRPGPAVVRATVELPEDLFQEARSLALDRGTSLNEVVADLLRRGLGQGTAGLSAHRRTD